MGVFKLFGRFALIMFNSFLWVILLANLFSFADMNPFEFVLEDFHYEGNAFDSAYFGFSSLIDGIRDMPKSSFLEWFYNALNALVLKGVNGSIDLSWMYDSGFGWAANVIHGLATALDIVLLPMKIIGVLLTAFVGLCKDIIMWIIWISKLLGGIYNTPVVTNPSPSYMPTSLYWSTSTYFNG